MTVDAHADRQPLLDGVQTAIRIGASTDPQLVTGRFEVGEHLSGEPMGYVAADQSVAGTHRQELFDADYEAELRLDDHAHQLDHRQLKDPCAVILPPDWSVDPVTGEEIS